MIYNRIITSALVAAILLVVADSSAVLADIYFFTDSRGVVHYTNVPTDPRYKRMPGIVSFSRPLPRRQRLSPSERSFDAHIQEAAEKYDVDPLLIKAVIKQESNFNPNATSEKGALGLMQLMPGTAQDMDVVDVFDPRDNILGGTRYLKRLSSQFNGDLALALASYNAGPDRVSPENRIPDIPETRNYVKSVLAFYNSFKRHK